MKTIRWNPLRSALSFIALAVLIAGCGGSGSGDPTTAPPTIPPSDPPPIVFTFLSVTPTEAVMCLADPGNTVVLNATPRDQNGQAMTSQVTPSFSSSDAGKAIVAADGLVRAIAAGIAQVTVSLTLAGRTHTAVTAITVANAVAGEAAGSVLDNHPLPHVGVITVAQLSAGNALTLNIQGLAFHAHTLNLTTTQVRLIAAGCRVSQNSSIDTHSSGSGPHSHTVTFN